MNRHWNLTVGDAFEFVRNGKSLKQDRDAGGLPITRIETIADGQIDTERVGYAGVELAGNEQWLLRRGDILFSHINSVQHVGKCAIYEGTPAQLIHGMNLLSLRPSKNLHPRYALYALRQPEFRAQLLQFVNKAVNQASVSTTNLKTMPFPLPPLDEQRRIAAILDKADALRQKRKRAIALLDSLTQSIFLEMFGDPVNNSKRFDRRALGTVCDVRDGTHDTPKYVSEGHPLLTSKNFSSGVVNYTDAKLISEKDYLEINKRSRVDKGDIVMPMIGTIGSPVIVDMEPDFAIKNVALFKFRDGSVLAEYVHGILGGRLLEAKVASAGRGGTQKFLSLGDLRSLSIPLPPIELQTLYKDAVRKIETEKANLSSAWKTSSDLFASLQHRAFSGQL